MSRDIQLAANLHRINALALKVIQMDVALTNMRVQRDDARDCLRQHCSECGAMSRYGGDSYLSLPIEGEVRH
jgi:hypothetical protein